MIRQNANTIAKMGQSLGAGPANQNQDGTRVSERRQAMQAQLEQLEHEAHLRQLEQSMMQARRQLLERQEETLHEIQDVLERFRALRNARLQHSVELCRVFVEEQCELGPQLYVELHEFEMRLFKAIAEKNKMYRTSFGACMPDAAWWKAAYGVDLPIERSGEHACFVQGIGLRESCTESGLLRDRVSRLEERAHELEARLTELAALSSPKSA